MCTASSRRQYSCFHNEKQLLGCSKVSESQTHTSLQTAQGDAHTILLVMRENTKERLKSVVINLGTENFGCLMSVSHAISPLGSVRHASPTLL